MFGEIQLIFIFNFTVLQVYSKSKDTQPKSPSTEICLLHILFCKLVDNVELFFIICLCFCTVFFVWLSSTSHQSNSLFFGRLHLNSLQRHKLWFFSLKILTETKDKSTTLKNDCKLWLASWNEVSEENLSCQKPSTVVQTGLKMFNRKQRKNTHYLHFPWCI